MTGAELEQGQLNLSFEDDDFEDMVLDDSENNNDSITNFTHSTSNGREEINLDKEIGIEN